MLAYMYEKLTVRKGSVTLHHTTTLNKQVEKMRYSVVVLGQSGKKTLSLTKIETLNTEHTPNIGRTHIECIRNKERTTAKQRKIR